MNLEKQPIIYNKGRSSDFMVRVQGGQGIAVKGKVEHIQTGQVQYFNDFLEMLMLIQNKLDDKGYPQCDTELRTFSEAK
jgi:hypothetical protein